MILMLKSCAMMMHTPYTMRCSDTQTAKEEKPQTTYLYVL